MTGLANSWVVVPIVSVGALQPMLDLAADSDVDYMLVEWVAALELQRRGTVKAMLPLLVGVRGFPPGTRWSLDADEGEKGEPSAALRWSLDAPEGPAPDDILCVRRACWFTELVHPVRRSLPYRSIAFVSVGFAVRFSLLKLKGAQRRDFYQLSHSKPSVKTMHEFT